jgi:hypothetical protein
MNLLMATVTLCPWPVAGRVMSISLRSQARCIVSAETIDADASDERCFGTKSHNVLRLIRGEAVWGMTS